MAKKWPLTSRRNSLRAGKFATGYALRDFPRAHQLSTAMGKENVKTSYLLHLSTIADFKISGQPWVKFQSAGWVNIQSAPTPEFYITKFSSIPYDSQAKCPTFLAFLHRIFEGKRDVIAYVCRILGYCLTGRTDAQVLFFFYGIGANGKSTLLGVVELLVGTDLAKQTPPETLMAQAQGNKPTNDVARLQGVRVVLSNEVEDGSWLAEATVKQLTGGDTITARFLYREFFEFKPEFKIIIAGNHKPVIRGTDYGIWRRIHVVAFPVIIPAEERDPLLPKKLEAELSGILNWAIQGCREWQRGGLKPPAAVTAAGEDYREEMDVLGHFMTDCCVVGAGHAVRGMNLYQRYSEWAKWGGFKPMTVTTFGRRLGERGLTKVRDADGVKYSGLKLKYPPAAV